ncbi:MAG: sulfotransferase family 2 domain-containing protein [Candidatus Marinimicrobia bacterium]|jgi:hypothetical protein|nr:sulfotransferase family 2 domain-containing protein [Candidatus Neomarinimicrobiota bacterium]|tara:strand:+ start:2418 stop:3236 length:819 start_codon:yes stop_codon:yes gene_type:complete
MNDTLIFLHLPRTGGTTLRDILTKQYSDQETFENKTLLDTDGNFNENRVNQMSGYKLIKGHVYFGVHTFIPQTCSYFSMMRDPVERTISAYNYIKKRANHPYHELANSLSIEKFIKSGENKMVNNGQTRLIAGRETSLNIPFDKLDKSHLETAKKNITDHFLLIGLTERYDETILLLKHMLRWDTPYYSIANAIKRDERTKHIEPKLKELIIEYNQLDVQLYDYVSRLFDEQIKKCPMVLNELEKFELKNRFFGQFQITARLKRKMSKWIKK